ncbi:unnamed protein product [Didymodactylos carnosus]|uniref:Uncharacterized protein n=1 Tax=Didymodactylos carnosus TaxID=1234261 RepID=A0A814C5D1_9BILA|nr:unnamed protein product [Didymodactylos carnosus]CAF3714197.1 unnamed protein product [Didymodactylos carnosus]
MPSFDPIRFIQLVSEQDVKYWWAPESEKAKDAVNAVGDKAKEVASGVSHESNKAAAKDSDRSAGDRISHGVDAVKDKVNAHGVVDTVVEKAKDAYNYVAETVQGAVASFSGDTNKETAKDSDKPMGERISAGASAVGDKVEQKTHEAKASYHKEGIVHLLMLKMKYFWTKE